MAIGLGFLSLVLYLSGIFIWLTPLPFLYAFARGGRLKGSLAFLVALLFLLILYHWLLPTVAERWGVQRAMEIFFWLPGLELSSDQKWVQVSSYGVFYFGFYALMGILLGEFERKQFSVSRLIGQTAFIQVFGVLLWLFWHVHGDWSGFVKNLENFFIQVLNLATQGTPPNEEVAAFFQFIKSHASQIAAYGVRLLPGVMINTLLFVLWLNVVVARKFLAKQAVFSKLGSLRQWRLPFAGVWAVILLALLYFADVYGLHSEFLKFLALNGFILFALLYFFQGLAIAAFYNSRWTFSPLLRLVLLVILVLLIQPIGIGLLLMIFGFFDSWFDFRKLVAKPKAG